MALKITIGVSGEKEINRALAVQTKAIKDLRPAWREIQTILTAYQKDVFLKKGKGSSKQWFGVSASSGLSAWKPLKPETVRQKAAAGYKKNATMPLIRTEKLMNAWTKKSAPGAIREIHHRWMAFGIDEGDIPYAGYHQKGTGRLPKRRHFRITNNLRKIITKVIQRYLAKSGQLVRQSAGIFK